MYSLPLPILDTGGDEQLGDQLVGEGGYVCVHKAACIRLNPKLAGRVERSRSEDL